MIFSCPNCAKKYQLSASVLGNVGRTVRCVACHHEWFQEPDLDDDNDLDESIFEPAISEDDGDIFDLTDVEEEADEVEEDELIDLSDEGDGDESEQEDDRSSEALADDLTDKVSEPPEEIDIPQGVKPLPNEDQLLDEEAMMPPPKVETSLAKAMGFAAAICLFFLFIVFALFSRDTIVSIWPPSVVIYDMAGFAPPVKGEGLIFDNLRATLDSDGRKIEIEGTVLNTTDKEISVPKMRALLKLDESNPENVIVIEPPVRTIAAGESFPFKVPYYDPPADASIINLGFVLEY
ncbi:MAG: zinc-ribbon domain-containing protein [Pseudomonadota bacterium]